jgi:hypothetical protein
MAGSSGEGGHDCRYIEVEERGRCAITKTTHKLHFFSQLVDSTKSTARSVENVQFCNIYCLCSGDCGVGE